LRAGKAQIATITLALRQTGGLIGSTIRLLTACFESHEAGSRLRLGWARRWSMRRIAARVTIASETSGSVS